MPAHVSWSLCLRLDRRLGPGGLLHKPGVLEDAPLVAARDVWGVAAQLVTRGRHENASHGVADPGEGARLEAVAEHAQRLAGHGSRDEPGYDLATGAVSVFSRTIDVEWPHDGGGQPIGAMEAEGVRLAGEFGGGIRRGRVQGMPLVHRDSHSAAVNLRRGDVDEPLDRAVTGREQKGQRPKPLAQMA